MEKIKDALAKAKVQKTGTSTIAKSVTSAAIANNGASSVESELSKIKYKNSSIIKLDSSHLEKNRIVSAISGDMVAGVFDSLRTQILQKMKENNWRTLAVVSPTPESGKTLVSINLAISIAHQPQKTVLLVDFDLRRPKVANALGIFANKSMNEYLLGEATIDEVMINPDISRLLIIPTMRPISRSSEMLSSNKVIELIKELRSRYDSRVVIFDLPPVLNSDDAMVLLPHVDCILLVVASGMSTEAEIEETMHHIPAEKLVGVVFNKAEVQPKTYYY